MGKDTAECTQNTHLRKTQRGCLPESLRYVSSLVVPQYSKRNGKIINSEKAASVFLEGSSRESSCLVRPAWFGNSPMVNRKGILKQKRAGENPQAGEQEKSVSWKVPDPIRGINNFLIAREKVARESPGLKSGPRAAAKRVNNFSL